VIVDANTGSVEKVLKDGKRGAFRRPSGVTGPR
jgi:hypothetical protein